MVMPLETLLTTCSHQEAEPQKCDGIARAGIADPGPLTPVYRFPNDDVHAEGTVETTGGRFLKIVGIC